MHSSTRLLSFRIDMAHQNYMNCIFFGLFFHRLHPVSNSIKHHQSSKPQRRELNIFVSIALHIHDSPFRIACRLSFNIRFLRWTVVARQAQNDHLLSRPCSSCFDFSTLYTEHRRTDLYTRPNVYENVNCNLLTSWKFINVLCVSTC